MLLLSMLEQILNTAKAGGHRVMLPGDVNAAPLGACGCYLQSGRLRKVDDEMDMWVRRQACREIMGVKLQATCAAFQNIQRAVLDRAFIFRAKEQSLIMTIACQWSRERFDYALINIRLLHSTAGIGYAGASCPENARPFNAALDARWIPKNEIHVATSGLGCSFSVWMKKTERMLSSPLIHFRY